MIYARVSCYRICFFPLVGYRLELCIILVLLLLFNVTVDGVDGWGNRRAGKQSINHLSIHELTCVLIKFPAFLFLFWWIDLCKWKTLLPSWPTEISSHLHFDIFTALKRFRLMHGWLGYISTSFFSNLQVAQISDHQLLIPHCTDCIALSYTPCVTFHFGSRIACTADFSPFPPTLHVHEHFHIR